MQFNQTFYHYQKEILKVFEEELKRWDNKIHIVAPPWSGKTIIGIEIMRELFLKKQWVSLILVPNTVLQKQWKDKINKFFIEENEKIENLVSFDMDEIKKINILTYQAISQQNRENLKNKSGNPQGIPLQRKNLEYFKKLKNIWVSSIVLDEAHHLTAWWSKVLFRLYVFLSTPTKNKDLNLTDEIFFHLAYDKLVKEIRPYVLWLTATPPFDDVDYFSLDKNYIDLLWEVDYYIPTPAIIKSGKLAPYNDLVQFVELPENASQMLLDKKNKLDKLILENKNNLEKFYLNYLDNYDKKISEDKYISWILAFCNIYLNIKSNKFNLENFQNLEFENIVYSLSIWIRKCRGTPCGYPDFESIFQKFKNILYEIWYVWKKSKFTKFYSFIDKLEIYNPEKINAIKNILNKELENLWDNLRCVIITDFFEDIDELLDCKNILKNLWEYKDLNPVLVSGQWIFDSNWEIKNKNILEITRDFNEWKIKLLIWTRGILWEWWDSPKVNTLIDLTGISSFMSVNQVRWRAIRQDLENSKKVSNIYDIITIDKNWVLHKDFDRLKKKHNQVYWVDDSGLVIKWIGHIFNKVLKPSLDIISFNKVMLTRSEKRNYFYKLWWVWKEFKNKEQFILQLNINPMFKFFPQKIWIISNIYSFFFKYKKIELNNMWKITYYDKIIKKYIDKFLYSAKNILIENNTLSKNFSYNLVIESAGKYKIIWWKNSDDFEIKKFIEIVSDIFTPILNQKYLFYDDFYILNNGKREKIKYSFPLPSQLSWNKYIRKKWYNFFNKDFIFKWMDNSRFVYINNDRKKYLWYSSFINCEIEKIWI